MGIYGKGARGKATRLHAQIIRNRGNCEACSSTNQLQCAHIVSRKFSITRTDLRNAVCLCAGCHRKFTDRPFEWVKWVDSKITAKKHQQLQTMADNYVKTKFPKIDWEQRAIFLTEVNNKFEKVSIAMAWQLENSS